MGLSPVWLMSSGKEGIRTQTHREKTMWGHRGKGAIYKLRREASEEINPADTLILDFQPLELWESLFLLFNFPAAPS